MARFVLTLRRLRLAALAAAVPGLLWGCAIAPQSRAEAQAATVKVYASEQLAPGQYEVVRELWVDSWRAAFWLPHSSSEAEGIASLQTEAARSGANGLINVSCRDQGRSFWSWSQTPAILCYGSAIRVR